MFAVGDEVFVIYDRHRITPTVRSGEVTVVRKVYFDVLVKDEKFSTTKTFRLASGYEKGEFAYGVAVPAKAWHEREERAALREQLSKLGVILRYKTEDLVSGLDVDQLKRILAIVEETA